MKSRKTVLKVPQFKIILVGDCGVGKTTLFRKFSNEDFKTSQKITTVDFRVRQLNIHDKFVNLSIWDTAGQQRFRSIVGTYFKSCHGVFLIFDVSDLQSWSNIQKVWYQMAKQRAPTASFLLIGNKNDLNPSVNKTQIIQWCIEKGIFYVQTSATVARQADQILITMAAFIDKNQQLSQENTTQTYLASKLKPVDEAKYQSIDKKQTRDTIKSIPVVERSQSFMLRKQKQKVNKQCCK